MGTGPTVRNDFATQLYDKLAMTHEGKNLFLSPFSIQMALAMCAVGAKGETRRVLTELIGAPESVEEQNRQYARLLLLIHGNDERPFQLVMANAIWGQEGFWFRPDFQEAIAHFYGGALRLVNFRTKPDEAVQTINTWVSDKTRQKIKELLNRKEIRIDTRLILTNAIYFKSRWEKEFQKADTRNEDWHGPRGIQKVLMMHQSTDFLYCEGEGFQALDLPYKGGQLSLLIVLPRHQDGLTSLEHQWAVPGTPEQVTSRLRQEQTVIVSLPRFKMETGFMLKPVLGSLGAQLAFSAAANFGGISNEPLMLDEVIHKAFVEVNEEGTEAAAATAVLMGRGSAPRPMPEPKVFKADHPFLFFIRDRSTNAVLFSGRVFDPK